MEPWAKGCANVQSASLAPAKPPALMNDIGLIVARASRAEEAARRLRYRLFGPQPENATGQIEKSSGEYAESDILQATRTLQTALDLLEEVEARLG